MLSFFSYFSLNKGSKIVGWTNDKKFCKMCLLPMFSSRLWKLFFDWRYDNIQQNLLKMRSLSFGSRLWSSNVFLDAISFSACIDRPCKCNSQSFLRLLQCAILAHLRACFALLSTPWPFRNKRFLSINAYIFICIWALYLRSELWLKNKIAL